MQTTRTQKAQEQVPPVRSLTPATAAGPIVGGPAGQQYSFASFTYNTAANSSYAYHATGSNSNSSYYEDDTSSSAETMDPHIPRCKGSMSAEIEPAE